MTTYEEHEAVVRIAGKLSAKLVDEARFAVTEQTDAGDLNRIVAHVRNKITTATYVLGEIEVGHEVDGELRGLAAGALSDLHALCEVLDALSGRE